MHYKIEYSDQKEHLLTLTTLTELIYGMKKQQPGITEAERELLEGYEQILLDLIHRLNG